MAIDLVEPFSMPAMKPPAPRLSISPPVTVIEPDTARALTVIVVVDSSSIEPITPPMRVLPLGLPLEFREEATAQPVPKVTHPEFSMVP